MQEPPGRGRIHAEAVDLLDRPIVQVAAEPHPFIPWLPQEQALVLRFPDELGEVADLVALGYRTENKTSRAGLSIQAQLI